MDAAADELLRLAFDRAPAQEANQAITRIRTEQGDELSFATSYELVLPAANVRAFLLEHTLPRLVDYLESSGAKLPHCGGVFLSVFSGDTLHFLRARDVVERMALALQAALLLQHAPPAVGNAYCRSRLAPNAHHHFGALPRGVDCSAIIERAWPATD